MADTRPNILVVMTDQQRFDTISALGSSFGVPTPAMDKLCKYGVAFENAFCTAPICSPSRSTIMTGLTPTQTGIYGNLGNPCSPLNERVITIGHRMQAAGYETVYHGKWHLGGNIADYGFETTYDNSHDASTLTEAARFWRNHDWLTYKRPFFHVVSFMDPHDIYFFDPDDTPTRHFEPWPNADDDLATKPWPQHHARAKGWPRERWDLYREFYGQRLQRADRMVAGVMDELLCSGFANNTWVIFTSDHGDIGGEHGLAFKGPYMYEGVMHVPLILVPPQERYIGKGNGTLGKPSFKGRRCSDLVSLLDLVPTVMDIAGIEPDPTLAGRSLLGATQGQAVGHDAVFGEWHQVGKMVTPIRMARTKRWKYNMHLGHIDELYDLENDPAEKVNLLAAAEVSSQAAAVRDELRAKLITRMERTGDRFFTYEPTDVEGKPFRTVG